MKFRNTDNFVLTRHAIERYAQRYGWGTYNFHGLKRRIAKAIDKEITKCHDVTKYGQEYWHVPSLNLRVIVRKDYKLHKNIIVTIVKNEYLCHCNLMKELEKYCIYENKI
jgi:predicted transglutaminase-like cysteine proteinase